MRYRKSFVTNSSSSCFISDVTGDTYSGMDMWLDEFNLVECENGHVLEESTKLDAEPINVEEMRSALIENCSYKDEEFFLEMSDDELSDYHRNWFGRTISERECPVCQMKYFTDRDMLRYALRTLGLSRDDAKEKMRNEFGSLPEMNEVVS